MVACVAGRHERILPPARGAVRVCVAGGPQQRAPAGAAATRDVSAGRRGRPRGQGRGRGAKQGVDHLRGVHGTNRGVPGCVLGPRPVPVSRNSCSRRCSPPCVLPAAARQEDMQRQLQVALRFVEWFSRRGESYEHNAAAIENHMKELAMTAHSRRVAGGVPECQPACSGSAACGCGCGGGAGSRHGGGSSHRAQPHTHAH